MRPGLSVSLDWNRRGVSPKWAPAVLPFQILCIAFMLRLTNTYAGSAAQARGWIWSQNWRYAVNVAMVAGGVFVLSAWGISGAAAAVLLATCVLFILMQQLLRAATHFSWRDILEPQIPALLCSAGIIALSPNPSDRRQNLIALTADGDAAFAQLDSASIVAVGGLLAPLAAGDRAGLVAAMANIRRLLGDDMPSAPVVLRPPRPGDIGHIVGRQAARARGQEFDEEADAQMRAMVEAQIEQESLPFFLSGRLYDDGVIDPRDTRTVLGLCLSAIHTAPVEGARGGFGVFRM